jgi:hypothetical protein
MPALLAGAVVLDQRARQVAHVAGGQVQALGAGGRHDVGGVAGQEQAAEAHRLGDEAAQRRDALLDRRAGDQASARLRVEARAQLVPEALSSDQCSTLSSASTARSSGCAWRCACCTARSRARGWHRSARATPAACRTARPASRTGRRARTCGSRRRHAGAADAVEAVAAGDEVALELVLRAVLAVAHAGTSPSKPCIATSRPRRPWAGPPALRASIRSRVTSVWP